MQIPVHEENPEILVNTVDIKVCVKDTDGNPIKDAEVELTGDNNTYSGTTGTAGGCTLRDVEFGEYDYTVSGEGYESDEGTLTVTAASTTWNIILSEE